MDYDLFIRKISYLQGCKKMILKIRLTLLLILLIYANNLTAQEPEKSEMQVMARVISSCIISTSKISNTPQLYCTNNVLGNNNNTDITYRISSTVSIISTSSSNSIFIITTIEF